MIWKLLACSTASMFVAVVALAWYAAGRPAQCPTTSMHAAAVLEKEQAIAQLLAHEYVHLAYPVWREKTGRDCPVTLADFDEVVRKPAHLDPWGEPYEITCTRGREPHLSVRSKGPDRKPRTADDIKSY